MLVPHRLTRSASSVVLALSLWLSVQTSAPASAAASDASCTLTFDAVWSQATHPNAFPPNPHFSELIGGTHDPGIQFWLPGALATPGIQSVAETGSPFLFRDEVETAMMNGRAKAVITGVGIGNSPGSTSTTFELSLTHPLVTVVTMIAPSPDWFVGTHGLPMLEEGQWRNQVIIDLPPYDAGTDSGISYTSSNQPTNPAQPISQITVAPFPTSTSLGTFKIDCTSDLIFFDGFEAGDLAVWSASIP